MASPQLQSAAMAPPSDNSVFVFPFNVAVSCLQDTDPRVVAFLSKPCFLPLLLSFIVLNYRQPRLVGFDWLLCAKLLVAGLLSCIQVVSTFVDNAVVGDVSSYYPSSSTSAIPCAIAIGLVIIVKLEHQHTLKSTARLALWLTLSFLFDAQRLYRHYFSPQPEPYSAICFLHMTLVLKSALILLLEFAKLPIASVSSKSETAHIPLLHATSSAGFWTRSFFICLNPTLPSLFGSVDNFPLSQNYLEEQILAQQRSDQKPSQLWFLLIICKRLVTFIFFLCSSRLALSICKLSQVSLVIQIVIFMQSDDVSWQTKVRLVAGGIGAYFGITVARCLFKGLCDSLTVMSRGAIIPTAYRKFFTIPDARRRQSELENIIDSQIDGLVTGIANIADSIAVVVEVAVSVQWLVQLVGYAALLLLAFPAVYAIVVRWLDKSLPESRQALETVTSLRLGQTSSLIAQVKALRIADVGDKLTTAVEKFRSKEIEKLTEIFHCRQIMTTTNSIFWAYPGPFIFAVASWISKGNPSSALVVHPLLALTAIFISAAMDVVRNIDKAKTMLTSASEIQRFLLLGKPITETTPAKKKLSSQTTTIDVQPLSPSTNYVVHAVHASLSPDSSIKTPVLKNLNLHINRGELAMVAGPSGCGKSTFLHAIMGQELVTSGVLRKSVELAGYCSQNPWLQPVSIRENIIGYAPFEADWYKSVVHSCLLDLDFSQLASRDLSVVGNHGLNLSKGQRCRIALARALYLRAPCLILDNVFSGLDEDSCSNMFKRIFGEDGIWHLYPSTVIMTTNSRQLLESADRAILMDSTGFVTMHTDRGAEYRRRLRNIGITGDNRETTQSNEVTGNVAGSNTNPFELSASKPAANYIAACYAYISSLDWESMKRQTRYLTFATVCMACADAFTCLWLSVRPANAVFVLSYWTISSVACFYTIQLCRTWYLGFAPLSALDIHQRLLDTMKKGNLSFVTQFSHSSMLNLFGPEIELVSEKLPMYFLRVAHQGGLFFAQLCLIAIVVKHSSPYLVVYALGFYITIYWYLRFSRPARIADASATAAMRANLAEMTAGLRHLKAFGWEHNALQKSNALLAESQEHLYYSRSIDRWMYLSVEAFRALANVTVIFLITFWQTPISLVGVGLMLVLPMKAEDATPILVEDCAILRNSLQTLGALLGFLEDAPVETRGASKDCVLESNWPHNGNIVFNNVTAKYNEKSSAPAVLKNASFNITAGHKIGVMGKSGSGKSSVLMALLNFLDYEGDIKIDGKNLSELSHRQLRRHIITISQDRIDLGGTVEHNLFPRGRASATGQGVNPRAIQVVLESLGLDNVLLTPAKGLQADISSLNLSNGQYRLISVARGMFEALLRGSNLVVIDDMTGNLDPATETRVLNALIDAFDTHTVIMEVSHADQVKKCDYTIHMEDGQVKEFRHNPNGPAGQKADQDKNRQLNLTRAREAQAKVNTTLKPGTRMQNSEIGPVPVADAYIKLMDVMAGVPGVSIEPPHQEGIAALRAAAAALSASIEASVSGGQTTTVASGSGSQVQTVEASGSGSGSQVQTAEASGSQTQATRASGSEVQTTVAQDPKGKGKAKEVLEPESETTEAPERDVQTTVAQDPKGKGKAKEVLDPKGKGKAKEVL